MNCWLVLIGDCSRPCNCTSEHPLVLSSNPGITKDDGIVIVDEGTRIPCCIAIVNDVKFLKMNEEIRIYVYLKDCDVPSEDNINRIMKIIRSLGYTIKITSIDQSLCIKHRI
ncbi:hypothetical protein Vdis_1470 [Vulcanisaeta distributa DSM 14429]|uniref:Uncharacterized protein n=1 Tax=Vulcanisaeta distributa (strain DSM 14429 / JCM 11212 / NBRC 100878 / IC-017) TaxID=572478 RepID=E1QSY9_VULDI|nr:hypothetical protein Vdis_1470 [Vulcanisaeta distributa DSM 14429]